jgi:ribose transport system permease protein
LIGYVLATFDFGSVQGFVTDLSYGVILVLSLLLTVALPYLHRWLRYVSPLLVFLALGLLFTGVALHATYDYTTLSPHGGSGSQADWIAAPVLEQVEQAPSYVRSPFSTRISQLIVLLLAVVTILRILVWQSAQRRMTPLLYAAVGVGGAVGLWLLMDTSAFVSRLGH